MTGKEYDEFLDEFVKAVVKRSVEGSSSRIEFDVVRLSDRYGQQCLIQFEDFAVSFLDRKAKKDVRQRLERISEPQRFSSTGKISG